MSSPIRSPTRSGSPSHSCASGWANPGSSPPCPASGTGSTQLQTKEQGMDREPGPSVRLKLTLSYAGFLMVAGALLLAVVWVFLLRYVPDGALITGPQQCRPGGPPGGLPWGPPGQRFVPNRTDLQRAFVPRAEAALAVLLLFGLLGGWVLAGRMLAPLTRITEAT